MSPPGSGGWQFPDRSLRQPVTVSAAGFARTDRAADVPLNFTTLLNAAGRSGTFDVNSLRVTEVDATGQVLNANVPFQFDRAAAFNATTNAEGTLVIWLAGTTPANVSRQFHVYFDVAGAGYAAAVVNNLLTVNPSASDEGFGSIRLGLLGGVTLDYHKLGGGFSSVVDSGGNDWVSWNSATGSAGDNRGIPNLVHPNDGGFFHPGRDNGSSTLVNSGPLKATIRSVSNPAGWTALWEIYPTYARMTVIEAAANYWFQYEGTPGGVLEATDQIVRSGGLQNGGFASWNGDIGGDEWVYVADPALGRSLYVVHEEQDTLVDTYRTQNDEMTILAFGRNDRNGRFLSATPQHFLFGFVDATGLAPVTTAIHNAFKPLAVSSDAVQLRPESGPVEPPATSTATPVPTNTPTLVPTHTPTPTVGPSPTATSEPSPTATAEPGAAVCLPPLPLDQWQRHLIDDNRPGRASFMFDLDVNRDGLTDFITGMFWYENPGDLTSAWTRHAIGDPLQDTIGMYDFDGDGDKDLLGTAGSTAPPPGGVWFPLVWARNDGPGIFTVLENIADDLTMNDNDPVQGVAIARFTPGGPLEVAVTWDDSERPERNDTGIQMFTVPSDPSTETWTRRKLSDFSLGEALSAVDVDVDGDMDLMLGTAWLRNEHPTDSWSMFTIHTPLDGEGDRHQLFDFNEDGKLDIVIGYAHAADDNKMAWYEQGDDITQPWTEHDIITLTTTAPKSFIAGIDVVDMDGDGDQDILLGEYRVRFGEGEYPAKLWLLENLGLGASWQPHVVYDGDSHFQANNAVDIDKDGDLDIISKGWLHSEVYLYENKAETTCTTP